MLDLRQYADTLDAGPRLEQECRRSFVSYVWLILDRLKQLSWRPRNVRQYQRFLTAITIVIFVCGLL